MPSSLSKFRTISNALPSKSQTTIVQDHFHCQFQIAPKLQLSGPICNTLFTISNSTQIILSGLHFLITPAYSCYVYARRQKPCLHENIFFHSVVPDLLQFAKLVYNFFLYKIVLCIWSHLKIIYVLYVEFVLHFHENCPSISTFVATHK